jgi:hypothetical protein
VRFHTGLHRARIQAGIGLTDLAARTRLSPRVVQRIDEGRFAELPGGVYARAYVRAFASEVGLDPKEVLLDLEAVLPPAEDPLDGLRAARQTAPTSAWLTDLLWRLVAAAVDAGVLLLIDTLFVRLIATTCGVSVVALLAQAGVAIAILCAIPVALYFLVFAGLGGRTPGASLCRLPIVPAPSPLRLRTILKRAVVD